jgi:peptide-methionine (S)-S-oxide reductase
MQRILNALAVIGLALVLGTVLLDAVSRLGEPAPQVTAAPSAGLARAVFAAGCFWCVEPPFDALPGVVSTTSGYTGGPHPKPNYDLVSAGVTGHTEAVEVVYDPAKVAYAQLLDVFWKNVDPFVTNQQFCDVGSQYRPGIFVATEDERRLAERSKAAVEARFGKKVLVEITAAGPFFRAEEYHQDYATKNPVRYKYYRWGCGRDRRLKDIWGDEGTK